ncbi:hypothetical protein XENTR_v10010760 [Xenopus tropicalis]|uniref:Metalloendopeptidase n=1 Tax=Xenopus tropicalis TaxID=8364 RepID=A0A803JSJ4_XENTR|nr:embryonic protein UVS.2 [Xenopus tropicalis]KAE8606504.1 hypothetical protein XENTR_v10010760 [Xenopus tropicalis]
MDCSIFIIVVCVLGRALSAPVKTSLCKKNKVQTVKPHHNDVFSMIMNADKELSGFFSNEASDHLNRRNMGRLKGAIERTEVQTVTPDSGDDFSMIMNADKVQPVTPDSGDDFSMIMNADKVQTVTPDSSDDFSTIMNADKVQTVTPDHNDVFSMIMNADKASRVRRVHGDIAIGVSRSALNCTDCLWQKINGTVYVPYTLDEQYSNNEVNTIMTAMQVYATLTCVQFVPYTDEDDYIAITSGDGCWSYMGRQGGAQVVSVQKTYCTSEGTTMHELNHALGFVHEHSRSDRDNYVDIMYQYISPGDVANFEKMNTNNLNTAYDYHSIMHYAAYSFSNTTGQNTIVAKPDPNTPLGPGSTMTSLDITKINRLYQCDVCSYFLTDATGTITSANYPSPYPNKDKCVWVIQAPSNLVTLTFSAFNLQSAPNCASDYIRVYDGRTRTSPLLLDRTCGSKRVPALIASSSMMLVEFVGSKNLKATGFSASYTTAICGGTYFTPSRNIISPGYPKNYPPNSNCSYIITAPASQKVSMSTNNFYTEPSPTCSNDYLSVYDGTSTNAPLLKTFCGHLFSFSVTSTGQNMFLRFISDSSKQASGFLLTYSFGGY